MTDPLVSCVMPTKDRRAFIPAALDCWRRQTYANKELIVVDDGQDPIEDIIPAGERIRYTRLEYPSRMSLGKKRNYCTSLALGDIVCNFDDDDWSAPDRIEYQVRQLQASGLPVAGFSRLLFWDINKQHARRYRAMAKGYVCGTTLCYLKSFWMQHHFPDIQVASDNGFVYPIMRQIAASNDESHMVARIHSYHTSSKNGIREVIDRSAIPAAFWENEKLRQPCKD